MKTDSGNWKRCEGNGSEHTHETSSLSITDLKDLADLNNDSKREVINPQYVSAGDQQFTINSVDVNDQSLVYNYITPDVIVTALKDDPTLTDNPAYVTKPSTTNPLLVDNPAYIALKYGPPSATTSDWKHCSWSSVEIMHLWS